MHEIMMTTSRYHWDMKSRVLRDYVSLSIAQFNSRCWWGRSARQSLPLLLHKYVTECVDSRRVEWVVFESADGLLHPSMDSSDTADASRMEYVSHLLGPAFTSGQSLTRW